MGLMRAASDAIGGVLGDQWTDFSTVLESDRRADRDRTVRAHSFGELAETGSVDGHTQTGIQA
ncbi:hypothetical protein E3T23_14810 [Cryobacterium cheniae]|uniref:Uncharacterized protein n=1 Tax=Cryobacterium cheniae TaxID=1259262 RepID=A0A4R8XHR7_9MICO|nr:hypothetical protein E3T23_14810 [Cryobacterium cheniae]